jgi:hypothetical protein
LGAEENRSGRSSGPAIRGRANTAINASKILPVRLDLFDACGANNRRQLAIVSAAALPPA